MTRTLINPAAGELSREWEDAELPGLPAGYGASVTVRLRYTVYPAEERTTYTPGWSSYAEVDDAEIVQITLYAPDGEEIDGLEFGLDRETVKAAFFAAHDERRLAESCMADFRANN